MCCLHGGGWVGVELEIPRHTVAHPLKFCKSEIKIHLSVCLTKQHAMTYWGVEVSGLLYPRERAPVPVGEEAGWVPEPV